MIILCFFSQQASVVDGCVFLCDRRRSRHAGDDRREVFIETGGLCEKPDTDERSAGPAARAGRRPAGARRPRRQSSPLLLVDIHTRAERLGSGVKHIPHSRDFQSPTRKTPTLLSVCRKTKKKAKRTSSPLYLCAFDQGLKAKDNQNPVSCSFSHEKIHFLELLEDPTELERFTALNFYLYI